MEPNYTNEVDPALVGVSREPKKEKKSVNLYKKQKLHKNL
jgi:hypothetical protein